MRALEAIGGLQHLLVPDNTKTAVIKACLYDPQVNRTYAEMAAHYNTAIVPARPRRPRDKAKVEQAGISRRRWWWLWPEFRDQPQNVLKQFPRHRDLSHLEDDERPWCTSKP